MDTSTEYYSKVLSSTKTKKSHGRKFNDFRGANNESTADQKRTRFDNFEVNMKRLGRKFDLNKCTCHEKYYKSIQSITKTFDTKNPTGKETVSVSKG